MLEIKSLKTQVAKLKTSANAKKTRVISKWLNENPQIMPEMTLHKWTSQLLVDEQCLEMVYREGIQEAVRFCIERELTTFKGDIAPIRAFTQKPNTIYVFVSDEEDPSICSWHILSSSQLERWICHIVQRFLVVFTQIQSSKIDEIYSNRKEEEKHNIMMIKLNGRQILTHDFKKWLISKIEKNIQSLADYEYV
jgi:hypothetical protein